MLVEHVFDSHADAWSGLKRPTAKSTKRNPFGDVYEPLPDLKGKWLASDYQTSVAGHVHGDTGSRFKDIEKVYRPGRHPKLLVGAVNQSYLWSSPMLRLQEDSDAGWRRHTTASTGAWLIFSCC